MRALLTLLLLVGALAALVSAQTPAPSNTSAPLDNCSMMGSCEECLVNTVCGWCAPTLSCHPGNMTGPTDGTRCVQEWYSGGSTMGPGICPDCAGYTSCVECRRARSCGWCEDPAQSVCQALGTPCAGGEPADQSCPCEFYEQCADCIGDGGCVFCAASGQCQTIDVVKGNCDSTSDELTNSCPCSAFKQSCEACSAQEGCGWCDGGKGGCVDLSLNPSCPVVHTCLTCPSSHGFNAGSFVGGLFLMLGIVVLLAGSYFLITNYRAGRQQYQTVQ